MVTFLVIILVLIGVGLMWAKFRRAKNKRPDERTPVESIMVSASVSGRKAMEETADQMRTAEISKEEGIQKTKDAISQLDYDFKKQIKDLMVYESGLSKDLETYKAQPSQYESKAKASKKKMQEAQEAGKPEQVVALHKKNAIMYLDMKAKAEGRIKKTEKVLGEIEINLEVVQATYENRKMVLQDMLNEFKSMNGAISVAKFNDNLAQIQAIKNETIDKLAQQNAEIKASNIISGINSEVEVGSAGNIDEGKYDDEFDKL